MTVGTMHILFPVCEISSGFSYFVTFPMSDRTAKGSFKREEFAGVHKERTDPQKKWPSPPNATRVLLTQKFRPPFAVIRDDPFSVPGREKCSSSTCRRFLMSFSRFV